MIRSDGYGPKTALTTTGSWSASLNGVHLAKKIVLYYKINTASLYSNYILYEDAGASTTYQSLSNNYNLKNKIAFDSDKAYDFYITAEDCFGGKATSSISSLPLGTPIFMIDVAQQAIGVNMFPEGKGAYIDGSIQSTGNVKGKKFFSKELGSTGIDSSYTIFATMSNSNEAGLGESTMIISSTGDLGGKEPGSYLVTISNRGSVPTITATRLKKPSAGIVLFGYYILDNKFYFGIFTNRYSYSRDILVLSSTGVTFIDPITTSSPPTG